LRAAALTFGNPGMLREVVAHLDCHGAHAPCHDGIWVDPAL